MIMQLVIKVTTQMEESGVKWEAFICHHTSL